MKNIWVIGDVHGCYQTMLALVKKLPADDGIVFAGDLIDRGPGSRQVVQFVIENGHLCVRGNHEQMMLDALTQGVGEYDEAYMDWQMNGGQETLNSYKHLPEDLKFHARWMQSLPVFLEFEGLKNAEGRHLVVSHSSVGRVWRWNEEKRKTHVKLFENTITWDRKPPDDAPGIYNIFGHTPKKEPVVKSFYANADTGAVFKGRGDYGRLTAIAFPSMEIIQQETIDDV